MKIYFVTILRKFYLISETVCVLKMGSHVVKYTIDEDTWQIDIMTGGHIYLPQPSTGPKTSIVLTLIYLNMSPAHLHYF